MYGDGGPRFVELMQQALSSVERGYDHLAPKFDKTPFRTPDLIAKVIVDEALRDCAEGDVLDLCCGTGALLERIPSRTTGRVVGVDLSQGMLDVARANVGDARVELVRGDATALGFDRAFDRVVSAGAFGHFLPDEQRSMVEGVYRALRPGGRFVFVTARPPELGSRAWWVMHGFDAAMRVRNALWRPPFVMYYASFRWPVIKTLLTRTGFDVTATEGAFSHEFGRGVLVSAQRPLSPR